MAAVKRFRFGYILFMLCCVFVLTIRFCIVSFAVSVPPDSEITDRYSSTINFRVDQPNRSDSYCFRSSYLASGSSDVFLYYTRTLASSYGRDQDRISVYLVSKSDFVSYYDNVRVDNGDDSNLRDPDYLIRITSNRNGWYVASMSMFDFGYNPNGDSSSVLGSYSFPSGIAFDSKDGEPWMKDNFVLGQDLGLGGGEGGGGSSSSTTTYDSSIPAPQNVQFKSESVGGFLGVGSKWEHTLSWSNGIASPPLYTRVFSVAEVVFADTGQFFEDSTIPLLSSDDFYKADSGRYSVGTDELSSKIMDGTVLNKVLEYRLQFYRYDDDGNLKVGPISTVHVKQNLFGKYDGYTVTTEYPKDESDLGVSGGMDDNYTDKWTSDGEHYDEYDKNGNLTGSGTSEDSGSLIKKIIDSLINIPTIINQFFNSLQSLMSGVGQVPAYLAQLFSFLPVEVISIIGLGILVVIVLRILGR